MVCLCDVGKYAEESIDHQQQWGKNFKKKKNK